MRLSAHRQSARRHTIIGAWARRAVGGGQKSDDIIGKNGAQGRTRTTDTRIFSAMLYQLSYLGVSRISANAAYRQYLGPCPARAPCVTL